MMMKDPKTRVSRRIKRVLDDAETALSAKGLKRVILALFENSMNDVIEKWEFEVANEDEELNNNVQPGHKHLTVIQAEIRSVLKQVLGN